MFISGKLLKGLPQVGDTEQMLRANCAKAGLRFRGQTPGDGNCFYRAVSDQLARIGRGGHADMNHGALRESVAEFLSRNHHIQVRNVYGLQCFMLGIPYIMYLVASPTRS